MGSEVRLWEGERERERAEHRREACVWRKPWDSRRKAAGLKKSQNESQLCPSVCISYPCCVTNVTKLTVFVTSQFRWVRNVGMARWGFRLRV